MKKLHLKLPVAYDNLNRSLQAAYESLIEFVRHRQGKDGFLMVNLDEYDKIYALVCDDDNFATYSDYLVNALRVRNDRLECIYDNPQVIWSTQDVADAKETDWTILLGDDLILAYPTLFNIMEVLSEWED